MSKQVIAVDASEIQEMQQIQDVMNTFIIHRTDAKGVLRIKHRYIFTISTVSGVA
jgi:hypothetical protein